MLQELVGDEVVPDLPEKIGQEDEKGEGKAGPEPGDSGSSAGHELRSMPPRMPAMRKRTVYLVWRPMPSAAPTAQPPARVFGSEKANEEVGCEGPPEVVKRGVLKFSAFKKRERRQGDCQGGGDLGEAVAAEFAGHAAGDEDGERLGEDGKEAESDHR